MAKDIGGRVTGQSLLPDAVDAYVTLREWEDGQYSFGIHRDHSRQRLHTGLRVFAGIRAEHVDGD